MRGIRSKKKAAQTRKAMAATPRAHGETYTWVRERGELMPRCKACGTVTPLNLWWAHVCGATPPKDSPPA